MKRYWRSIDDLAGSPAVSDLVQREFPNLASEWPDHASRRRFLSLMAASMSLAGLTGCTKQPAEFIYPYVTPPEQVVPGQPLYFATAISASGLAQGVLVESHEGRPTKVEGNPAHPASLGATDVASQASVLDLYDPDRLKAVRGPQAAASWGEFGVALRSVAEAAAKDGGARLRFLSRTITSPTLASQAQSILSRFPNARWIQYDPAGPHAARAGAMLAFGQPLNTWYRFDAAQVVLALDSDFLACGPASTRYAHDFMTRRRVRGSSVQMNRLYAVESTMTSTGGKADHRWPLRPSQIELFAEEIAAGMGVAGADATARSGAPFVSAVLSDLKQNHGAALVIPGECASPRVHAIAHAINSVIAAPAVHTAPLDFQPADQISALTGLVGEMNAGTVDTLFVLGGNPVYDAPADLDFGAAARKVRSLICLAQQNHETAESAAWLVPETHELEAWSDVRAFDGSVTIQQPLIAPLYEGRSVHEVLSALNGEALSSYEAVRRYWTTQRPSGDFEAWWRRSVHDGLIEGSALPAVSAAAPKALPARNQLAASQASGIELDLRPDPYLRDGMYANNSWLQELPRPISKLTWDNAAYVSPKTAAHLKLETRDVIEIEAGGRKIQAPVMILPGQAEDCITLPLGYGRTRAGRAGTRVGFDAGKLRVSGGSLANASVRKTGRRHALATTQIHHAMDGRDIVISEPLSVYTSNPDFVHQRVESPPKALTIYKEWNYTGYAWGMAIDQTACVNCSACVIACQAENNIPVVGKDQVMAQRAMHWLRVDSYFEGSPQNPSAHYQPVPCMHCEQAPCELVCPTQATNHSSDGLNDMVYNRCVGTRYCSNNCPYKVRRFNFFLYADWNTPSLKLQRNPDVTVRSRGVMEKCTYCVQRIREAEITARKENRSIRDGEVVPACAQVCPTQAIVFGNINDRQSQVARLKADKLNYGLLADLNTRPRTTYLAELRNPSPEVKE